MFRECAAAAAYDEQETEQAIEELTATTNEPEAEQAATDEVPENDESNNEVGRMMNLRHLIMLRADQ